VEANGSIANQDRGTKRDTVSDNALETIEDVAEGRGRSTSGTVAGELRIDLTLELLLNGGIECEDFQFAIVAEKRLYEGASQNLASRFDQCHLVFVDWRSFEQSFQD